MAEKPLGPIGNQRLVLDSDARCTTVDAGAGTGKTTTMLLRIERLVERGVDPGEILVLTFANEAAATIREAIRERLDPATAAEVDVHTYHSWCYRLVREHAYLLGRSPDLEVVTEHRRRRLIERLLATEDYPGIHDEAATSGIGDIAEEAETFVSRLSAEDIDPATVLAALPDEDTLAVLAQLCRTLETAAADRLTFDEEALRYFSSETHLERSRGLLLEYARIVAIGRDRLAERGLEHPVAHDVDRYLEAMADSALRTRRALTRDDPSTKHLPRALFCNQIFGTATGRLEQSPIGRLRQYLDFLREARQYALVYRDYRRVVEEAGAVDFDQLVREAASLLSSPEARPSIVDRWSWVCCDEFQDTDETQFGLLTALARGADGPSLLAIGDTDQAIYGWRGTDPTGLTRLGATFEDHESASLERNFRSSQAILDLANHCEYGPHASKPLRAHEDDSDEAARVVTVESDDVGIDTPDQVARTVTMLLNGELEGVPRRSPGDVAIIVRTNAQARRIGDALRAVQLPHTITGSPRGRVSPGLQTLVSYLRVVLDPDADAHLRRVLFYRYRVPEADLATLHAHDGSLDEALTAADATALEAPERVERARTHLAELRAVRAAAPLSTFLERLLAVTDLEWYLTPGERDELERVHRFVALHEGDEVLTTLTQGVIDGLERTLRGPGGGPDRGSRSADRIDVMTVHQAKGLEFDTVLVPFCSDEHWCVERDYAERSRYELLAALLDGDVESPLCADLATESVREEWRVFHVAITRAESHLVLFGSPYDYDGGDGLGVATADACLAPPIEWSVAGQRMDLWATVGRAVEAVAADHPGAVVDRTEALASAATHRPGRITYYEGYGDRQVEPLETQAAIETVHRLGGLLRRGSLLAAADAADLDLAGGCPTGRHLEALTAETVRYPVAAILEDEELPPTIHHSHSALATFERCPRQHYLDHVVRAIEDPAGESVGSANRVVGSLFHAVAEEAFHRGYRTRERWRTVARRQATALDHEDHLPGLLACVDRYFEVTAPGGSPLSEWEELAAERPISLESVDGVDGTVVGYVDSIRRAPDGQIVVLDYKATSGRIPAEEATQLTLYLEACERTSATGVDAAGYVYVGEAGPALELFTPSELPPWSAVREGLQNLDRPRYDEYDPGEHCRGCPHTSLGCAPQALYR